MNRFEDRIREALLGRRESVDPAHVAGFQDFLLEKKRRRRRVAVWYFLGVGAVVAGVTLLALTGGRSSSPASSEDYEDVALRVMTPLPDARESGVFDQSVQSTTQTSISEKNNNHSPQNTESATNVGRVDQSADINVSSTSGSTLAKTIKNTDQGEQSAQKAGTSAQTESEEGSKEDDVDTNQQTGEEKLDLEIDAELPLLTRIRVGVLPPLQPVTVNLPIKARSLINPIQPVNRRHLNIRYGLTGSWYVTQPKQRANQTAGTGLQAGAFISIPLSQKWTLSGEGGFMHFNDIDFSKQSVTSQFGFTQRSQANTLTMQETYAWYAGLSGMYRVRRHSLEMGVQVYHVYGARRHHAHNDRKQPGTCQY